MMYDYTSNIQISMCEWASKVNTVPHCMHMVSVKATAGQQVMVFAGNRREDKVINVTALEQHWTATTTKL